LKASCASIAASAHSDELLLSAELAGGPHPVMLERWREGTRVTQRAQTGTDGRGPLIREIGFLPGGGWFAADGRITTFAAELRPTWSSPAPATGEIADGHAGATADGHRVLLYAHGALTAIDAIAHRVIARSAFPDCGASVPAMSPDGVHAAVLDENGVTIIDTATAAPVGSLALPSAPQALRAVTWSSSDEVVALASGTFVFWKPLTGFASG
jgi:hypothetical protein